MTDENGKKDLGPAQLRGPVLTVRQVDAYHVMTVAAPRIARAFRPGQFVAVAVGGPDSAMLMRRAFSIYDVRPDHGGTVEFVFAARGPGTRWLADRRARDVVDIAGPLGRPFPQPRGRVSCLLVGGGYGSAPLFPLADRLRARADRAAGGRLRDPDRRRPARDRLRDDDGGPGRGGAGHRGDPARRGRGAVPAGARGAVARLEVR